MNPLGDGDAMKLRLGCVCVCGFSDGSLVIPEAPAAIRRIYRRLRPVNRECSFWTAWLRCHLCHFRERAQPSLHALFKIARVWMEFLNVYFGSV